MLRPGQHSDPLVSIRVAAVDVRGIVIVEDRVGCNDVDASDRVDHFDQP
jgi:hypothetical protein